MNRHLHAAAMGVVIKGDNLTSFEQLAIELAIECDQLVDTIESDGSVVNDAFAGIAVATTSLHDSNHVFRMNNVGRVLTASAELSAKRDMLRRLLIAMNTKGTPDKWHIFCNAWKGR